MANQGVYWVKNKSGGKTAPLQWYYSRGSETCKRGWPLRISMTSGSVYHCSAAAAATAIIGVAAADWTTTATELSTRVGVIPASDENIFEGKSVTGTGLAHKYFGKFADFAISTTTNWRINPTAGSVDTVKILDVHPDDRLGTGTGKRFWFIFNPAKSSFDGTEEV